MTAITETVTQQHIHTHTYIHTNFELNDLHMVEQKKMSQNRQNYNNNTQHTFVAVLHVV